MTTGTEIDKTTEPPARRRWSRLGVVGLAWLTTVVMATACVARWTLHDWVIPLVWFNSFTAYVYLPAWPIALWAWLRKRPRMATIALAIAACQVAWMVPDFLPPAAAPSSGSAPFGSAPPSDGPSSDARPLRVMSGNINSRLSYPYFIRRIGELAPDLVLLQEYTHSWRYAIEQSQVPKIYPYSKSMSREGSDGIALFSKWPLENAEIWEPRGIAVVVATVVTDRGRLRLYNVHAPMPRSPGRLARIDGYWADVAARLRTERGPLAIVGDFNMTQHARSYQCLLDLGLHAAHRECGRGYATTWPNGVHRFVPPIRIDHALLSAQVHCLTIREDEGHIADHKPLVLDIVWE